MRMFSLFLVFIPMPVLDSVRKYPFFLLISGHQHAIKGENK
jgi:hypothetical protein